jgi:hypothetical protein
MAKRLNHFGFVSAKQAANVFACGSMNSMKRGRCGLRKSRKTSVIVEVFASCVVGADLTVATV